MKIRNQAHSKIKTSIRNKFANVYRGAIDLMRGVSVPKSLFNELSKPSPLNFSPIPIHPWFK